MQSLGVLQPHTIILPAHESTVARRKTPIKEVPDSRAGRNRCSQLKHHPMNRWIGRTALPGACMVICRCLSGRHVQTMEEIADIASFIQSYWTNPR